MIQKFRKKPVVIEAVQWNLENKHLIGDFLYGQKYKLEDGKILIETLEGTMATEVNDWIIKGVKGEFYPCKPDIFQATYEPVK